MGEIQSYCKQLEFFAVTDFKDDAEELVPSEHWSEFAGLKTLHVDLDILVSAEDRTRLLEAEGFLPQTLTELYISNISREGI